MHPLSAVLLLSLGALSASCSSSSEGTQTQTAIYAAGISINASNVWIPGYWRNGTWTALSSLDSARNSMASSIAVSGGNVYVAGYSYSPSNLAVGG